jgi:hypothetical protein
VDVGTVDSGLNSVVLANNNEMILLPINEPTYGTKRKSQIQTYLEQNQVSPYFCSPLVKYPFIPSFLTMCPFIPSLYDIGRGRSAHGAVFERHIWHAAADAGRH